MAAVLQFERPPQISAGTAIDDPLDDLDIDAEHAHVVKLCEAAFEASTGQHEQAEKCRAYVNGEQWTKAELAKLKARGQPAMTTNYIVDNVEWHKGYERQNRSDPCAYPRNPADEQAATAATDALRYIVELNKFDDLASESAEYLLVEGEAALDITVVDGRDPKTGQPSQEVQIELVPPDRLIRDPHSRKLNAEDASYKGVVTWMNATDVLEDWPEARGAIEASWGRGDVGSLSRYSADRPENQTWCDARRTRVKVIQLHYLRGDDWWLATFTKGGFLDAPAPSPYVDEKGRHVSSLVIRGLYIDKDNHRFGKVKHWISPQDSVNKLTSKHQHLISVNQFVHEDGAIDDVPHTKRQLARADGDVKVNPGFRFELLTQNETRAAQAMSMLQLQLQQLQRTGPSPALMGDAPRDASGRAIQAAQQGGEVQYRAFLDVNIQMRREVYRQCWLRARQFWTAERWVRITDDESNVKFVGLNHVTTIGEHLNDLKPKQRQNLIQRLGIQGPQDPRLQQQVIVNTVADLDVDILVQESQDVATIQSEQYSALVDLVKNRVVAIPPKVLIQASSLRNKDQLIDALEAGPPPEVQQMQQQLQQATEQMKAMAAEIDRLKARDEIERRKADISAFGAETDRMKVLAPAADPMQIATLAAQTALRMYQANGIYPDLTGTQMQPPNQAVAPRGDMPPEPMSAPDQAPAGPAADAAASPVVTGVTQADAGPPNGQMEQMQ